MIRRRRAEVVLSGVNAYSRFPNRGWMQNGLENPRDPSDAGKPAAAEGSSAPSFSLKFEPLSCDAITISSPSLDLESLESLTRRHVYEGTCQVFLQSLLKNDNMDSSPLILVCHSLITS